MQCRWALPLQHPYGAVVSANTLQILDSRVVLWCLQGEAPPMQSTLDLFNIMTQAGNNLQEPVQLERQLLEDTEMEQEVGLAMVQLLKVSKGRQLTSVGGANPLLLIMPARVQLQ